MSVDVELVRDVTLACTAIIGFIKATVDLWKASHRAKDRKKGPRKGDRKPGLP